MSPPPRSRWRLPAAFVAWVALGMTAALALWPAGIVGRGPAAAATPVATPEAVSRGQALFGLGCSSCHGLRGEGTERGPTLVGVGAAAADFQLTTGRMPLASPGARTVRKPPAYRPDEIDALVAYVASLGEGPPVPQVDVASADLVAGGELFRADCAACHNAAGTGGALSYGRNAPSLLEATAVQVVEAMRTGPGQMPVFGPSSVSDAEAADAARYVTEALQHPDNRGGLPLGSTGPVPEGFVAWIVGLVVIGGALRWIVGGRHG